MFEGGCSWEWTVKCINRVKELFLYSIQFFVVQSLSRVQLFVILWTVIHQVPPFQEIFQARMLEQVAISFFRGIFLTQGLNPYLLHWQVDCFTTEPPGKPRTALKSSLTDSAFSLSCFLVFCPSFVSFFKFYGMSSTVD